MSLSVSIERVKSPSISFRRRKGTALNDKMNSCIVFLLTEGTARILSYSHNAEVSIEVRVAGNESNEDPQILPRKVRSKARS